VLHKIASCMIASIFKACERQNSLVQHRKCDLARTFKSCSIAQLVIDLHAGSSYAEVGWYYRQRN